jgi:hypothetical protein
MTFWTTLLVLGALAGADATQAAPFRPVVSARAHAAVLADVLPRKHAFELRPRVSFSVDAAPNRWSRLRFDARAEALAADRDGYVDDAVVRVTEAWVEAEAPRADLRAGLGRLVWGRLDEVSPADVVNPIDAARFLLEGRSEARLPVALVRGRIFPSERVTIEGVLAPVFARGRFDELAEPSSPFNLAADAALSAGIRAATAMPEQDEPATTPGNVSGGGRVLMTIGRVDVTALAYRGFDAFGPVTFEPGAASAAAPSPVTGRLVERHPRFTILGADVETVTGEWAWRAEVVASIEKSFASASGTALVGGRAFDAGAGFDRRAGDYRVYASVLVHREWSVANPAVRRTDVNVVGSVERPFARDRYLARMFAVVNPGAGSAFVRGVLRWQASDRASVEGSVGGFLGTSDDRIGRFRNRDFAFVRFGYDF